MIAAFERPVGGVSGPGPSFVQTASGRHIDINAPEPSLIRAEDIARGLALTCRYGGQLRRFYSVAEHSVLAFDLGISLGCTPREAFGLLAHDMPEALLGDVITPLKYSMRGQAGGSPYDIATDALEQAIAERFSLDVAELSSPLVEIVDQWALRIEVARLVNPAGGPWHFPEGLPNGGELPGTVSFAAGLDWMAAEALFLERLASIIGWDEVWA